MLENILYSITNYDYTNDSLLVLEGNLYLCDLKVRTNKLICFGLENFYWTLSADSFLDLVRKFMNSVIVLEIECINCVRIWQMKNLLELSLKQICFSSILYFARKCLCFASYVTRIISNITHKPMSY